MPVANCPISRPNCPTADVATKVTTRPDHDDRLDDGDRHRRRAGHPAGEQVGQRAEQGGDQQADEHRDRDEVQPPQRHEHQVDRHGDGDGPPRVPGRDAQPVAHRLVRVGAGGRRVGRRRSRSASRDGGCGPGRGTAGPAHAQARRWPPAARTGSKTRHRPRFLTASPCSRGCRPLPGSVALIPFLGRVVGPLCDPRARRAVTTRSRRARPRSGGRTAHRSAAGSPAACAAAGPGGAAGSPRPAATPAGRRRGTPRAGRPCP